MSHMVTRKGPVGEDKDKRQTDSPVKEMKKKIAANAEKEKLAAEKNVEKATEKQIEKATDKATDKKDKPVEKQADKADKKDKSFEKKDKTMEKKEKIVEKSVEKKEKSVEKSVERKEKSVEKSVEKKEKSVEKSVERKEKNVDKNVEKPAEKKSVEKNVEKSVEKSTDKKDKVDKKEPAEKPKEEGTSTNKNEKKESEEERARRAATARQNGDAANGNGTASGSEDEELVIVEQDGDEMFPELAYDDNSDADGSEPEPAGRSVTRRSQVKVTRTPETPRPASDKQADKLAEADDSKEPKLLKLKEDLSDRRLRSAGSPKPSERKGQEKESPKSDDNVKKSDSVLESKPLEHIQEDKQEHVMSDRIEMEVENSEEVPEAVGGEMARRDTRYSRSRVKVSPYRRSARLADNTASSTLANYTGNNTTMEMDITESSVFSEEPSTLEDSYLSGLRSIRGRRSYKPLKQMALRNITLNTSQQSAASISARESGARPTGTVVGRKRRPDAAHDAAEVSEVGGNEPLEAYEAPKRARLLDRLARPFRTHSTPLPARRAAEIVGINTDLPLTAPVAAADTFDPETIKPTPTSTSTPSQKPAPTLAPTPTPTPTADRDSKRCIVM